MKRNRRTHLRNKRSRSNINKYVFICAFIAIFAIILAATGMFVQANEKNNIVYSSIEIKEHDTLWDIATRYCDTDEESINEYIDNIKDINSISSDNITSGNYLIIYEYK